MAHIYKLYQHQTIIFGDLVFPMRTVSLSSQYSSRGTLVFEEIVLHFSDCICSVIEIREH